MAMVDEMRGAFRHQIQLTDDEGKVWKGRAVGFVPDYDNEEDDEQLTNRISKHLS